ncbi:hypothetical protein SFR_6972 (plasmid) [Streptomyces sp. FR-008]|nr:hypothetical protein SFR_6972 [Streptomyces sp. FR-008]
MSPDVHQEVLLLVEYVDKDVAVLTQICRVPQALVTRP